MPIRIDLHDNSSEVKVRPRGKDQVEVESGCEIDKKRFEALLDEEIKNRILGDKELSARIDDLEGHYVKYLDIDELEDGRINISLINDKGEVIDTKTITLTEKIIKSAKFDEENKKLIYTCNDDSVIELDISSIVDNVEELISKVAVLETKVENINSELSILDARVENTELQLSTVINETIPGINQEISEINSELSIVNQNIDSLDERLDTAELSIVNISQDVDTLRETKVETNLSIYPNIKPKDMEIEDVRDLLVYVSENGTTGFNAKLSELGYSRIKNIEDIDKVDTGDILIDME